MRLLDWDPPSSNHSAEIHGPIARGDGCPDVWEALKLSGEPPVPEIASLFKDGGPKPPIPLPEYEDLVVHMKEYRCEYHEYWTSSAEKTKSDDPKAYHGSPAGVQIIGRRLSEEHLLEMAQVVVDALRQYEQRN
ncbi:hypothetical protein Daesc_007982 [Daldinia eschscholtzii]|uniref:Amidase n=1 Tax=Daldinia eschscholtzii TaxID=292717 RepID=A0AAX6MGA0_9PEZI